MSFTCCRISYVHKLRVSVSLCHVRFKSCEKVMILDVFISQTLQTSSISSGLQCMCNKICAQKTEVNESDIYFNFK